MPQFENGQALLAALRERLDDWVSDARVEAYGELFEGPDAAVTEAELQALDRIDSRLSRERGEGLWGADSYGIAATGTLEEESTPQVVCTHHPQVPEYAVGRDADLDDGTHRELDEASASWNCSRRTSTSSSARPGSRPGRSDGDSGQNTRSGRTRTITRSVWMGFP